MYKKRLSLFCFIIFITFVTSVKSQVNNDIYDLVPVKTLELDNEISTERTKIQLPKAGANVNDISLPSITFRYGVFKDFEVQFNIANRMITTNAKATIPIKRGFRTINVSNDVTGLDAISFGIKAGLLHEKKSIPSIALSALFTIPKTGMTIFQANNPGIEFYLNFYNTLSRNADFAYSIGTIWTGYSNITYPYYYYSLTPSIYANDNLSFFIEATGYLSKHEASDNRISGGLDYTFSDILEGNIFLGTSVNHPRGFFFFGGMLTLSFGL